MSISKFLSVRVALSMSVAFLAALHVQAPEVRAQEKLLEGRQGEIEIAISFKPDNSSAELVIKASDASDANIFALESPGRLVVDLPKLRVKTNKAFTPKPNPLFKSVRVGSHDDKVRVVIDLIGTTLPSYHFQGSKSQVSIKIDSKGTNQTLAATSIPTIASSVAPTIKTEKSVTTVKVHESATPTKAPTVLVGKTPSPEATLIEQATATFRNTATSTPVPVKTEKATIAATSTAEATATKTMLATKTATPSRTATATKTATSTKTEKITPTATLTPVAKVQPSATPEPTTIPTSVPTIKAGVFSPAATDAQVLSAIMFDHLETDRGPVLKFILTRRAQFNLIRLSDKTYQLSINGCRLGGKELGLPQFPPHDFAGYTFVSASERLTATVVTIGVERGVRLSSSNREGEIWIRAALPEK